jgi:hypothetical protein
VSTNPPAVPPAVLSAIDTADRATSVSAKCPTVVAAIDATDAAAVASAVVSADHTAVAPAQCAASGSANRWSQCSTIVPAILLPIAAALHTAYGSAQQPAVRPAVSAASRTAVVSPVGATVAAAQRATDRTAHAATDGATVRTAIDTAVDAAVSPAIERPVRTAVGAALALPDGAAKRSSERAAVVATYVATVSVPDVAAVVATVASAERRPLDDAQWPTVVAALHDAHRFADAAADDAALVRPVGAALRRTDRRPHDAAVVVPHRIAEWPSLGSADVRSLGAALVESHAGPVHAALVQPHAPTVVVTQQRTHEAAHEAALGRPVRVAVHSAFDAAVLTAHRRPVDAPDPCSLRTTVDRTLRAAVEEAHGTTDDGTVRDALGPAKCATDRPPVAFSELRPVDVSNGTTFVETVASAGVPPNVEAHATAVRLANVRTVVDTVDTADGRTVVDTVASAAGGAHGPAVEPANARAVPALAGSIVRALGGADAVYGGATGRRQRRVGAAVVGDGGVVVALPQRVQPRRVSRDGDRCAASVAGGGDVQVGALSTHRSDGRGAGVHAAVHRSRGDPRRPGDHDERRGG